MGMFFGRRKKGKGGHLGFSYLDQNTLEKVILGDRYNKEKNSGDIKESRMNS